MTSTTFSLSSSSQETKQTFREQQAQLIELDSTLKSLNLKLPEKLCASSAKNLVEKAYPLTPDSPIFAKLHRRIASIDKHLRKAAPAAKTPLTHLQSLYQDYLYQNCAPQEDPLLFAAHHGHLAKIQTLLQEKADFSVTDDQGRTAMHLACIHGHVEVVKALYKVQNLIKATDIQLQTPLHLAAFYGQNEIVEIFTTLTPELLEIQDEDGRTPLHTACTGEPSLGVVETLLKAGADVGALNSFENTPMHLAVKHGHLESLKLLLKYSAKTDILNQNKETPIDLAIGQGFDDLFYTLLYSEGPQTSDEPPENPEKLHQYYTEKIREALSIGTPLEQVYFIDKAASLGIEQEDYLYAATLLNAALAIAKKEEFAGDHLNYLYSKLERVEGLFLYSLGIKTHEHDLEKRPIREVLETLTDSFNKHFAEIIEHSTALLGKPSTEYAFVGLGSMARGEMCFYSGMDFNIPLKEANETTLPYFENLCKLIQLKIFQDLGNAEKALEFLLDAVKIEKEIFGNKPHPSVPTSLFYIGNAYKALGTTEGALEFLLDALKMFQELYGNKPHPSVARSLNNIGNAYKALGTAERALEFLLDALKMFQELYGNKPHPEVAISLSNIGAAYQYLGNAEKALEFGLEALKMKVELHGNKPHPDVAISLSNIGDAYQYLGNAEKALEFGLEALKMKVALHGNKPHPEVAISLSNIGNAYQDLGNAEKALEFGLEALKMNEELYGNKPHPEVAFSLSNIGETYSALGDEQKALAFYLESLKMEKELYGNRPHPDVAISLSNIGETYSALGDEQKALEYEQLAEEMEKQLSSTQ